MGKPQSEPFRALVEVLGMPWDEIKDLRVPELQRIKKAYDYGFAAGRGKLGSAELKARSTPPDITARERLGDAMGRAAAYWIQEHVEGKDRPTMRLFYIPSKELRAYLRDIHSRADYPVRSGFGVPHPSRITVVLKKHLHMLEPMMKRLLRAKPKIGYDAHDKLLSVVMPSGWRLPVRTT